MVLDDIVQRKLPGRDNRLRQTDTAPRRVVLRVVQSIPSPFAEPFKVWLAQVGDERLAEIENPALVVERMREGYRKQGYSDAWIDQRLRTDMIRNELTDEWKARGVEGGVQFAVLTNEISDGTFGLSVRAHRAYKLLPKTANVRDHMTNLELALISLGEATTTELHHTRESQGLEALVQDAHDGGAVAGKARRDVEEATGRSAVSASNHLAQIAAAKTIPKRGKGRAQLGQATEPPPADDPRQQSFLDEEAAGV